VLRRIERDRGIDAVVDLLKSMNAIRHDRGVRVVCDRCGSRAVYRMARRQHLFQCEPCNRQFSATSNTGIHKSHVDLSKWVAAAVVLKNMHPKRWGAAKAVQRATGVTYKTAWWMKHDIYMMADHPETRFTAPRRLTPSSEISSPDSD